MKERCMYVVDSRTSSSEKTTQQQLAEATQARQEIGRANRIGQAAPGTGPGVRDRLTVNTRASRIRRSGPAASHVFRFAKASRCCPSVQAARSRSGSYNSELSNMESKLRNKVALELKRVPTQSIHVQYTTRPKTKHTAKDEDARKNFITVFLHNKSASADLSVA